MTLQKRVFLIVATYLVVTLASLVFVISFVIKPILIDGLQSDLITQNLQKSRTVSEYIEESLEEVEVLAAANTIQNYANEVYLHEIPGEVLENEFVKDEYIKRFMRLEQFYDLFLIDVKHGDIHYSYLEEKDLQQSVFSSQLKDTELYQLWSKVKDTGNSQISDIEKYELSGGIPSLFVGTPIYYDGNIIAVLVIQITYHEINDIMQARNGYQATREDFLVGSDGFLRSDTYLNEEEYNINNSMGSTKFVNKEIIDSYPMETLIVADTYLNYANEYVFGVYSTIQIDDDTSWYHFSEISVLEGLGLYYTLNEAIIIIVLTTWVLGAIVLFYALRTRVIIPIQIIHENLASFFEFISKRSTKYNKIDHKYMSGEIKNLNNSYLSNVDQIVTNIKRTEELSTELNRTLTLFGIAEEATSTYLYIYSDTTEYFQCSNNMFKIFGISEIENATKTEFNKCITSDDTSHLLHIDDDGSKQVILKIKTPKGEIKYIQEKSYPYVNELGDESILVSGLDVTRRVLSDLERANLISKVEYDTLTRAYTRDFFYNNIHEIYDNDRKYGKCTAISLLDLDKFKQINDVHGHEVGDQVLAQAVHALKETLRISDYVVRWGGDEIVLITGLKEESNLMYILDKCRQTIELEFADQYNVTCSIGGVILRSGESVPEVLKRADREMYNAKNKGRNTVSIKL